MNHINLLLITEFNNNLKLKKLTIEEVVDKMNEIENLLKLNFTSGFPWPGLDRNKVYYIIDGKFRFNYCLFSYIDHYKHLSNNPKELTKIKDIGRKIAKKFRNYLSTHDLIVN